MDLRRSIATTVSYAEYFDFPLFPEELHYWLVCSKPVSFALLSPFLPKKMLRSARLLRSKTALHTSQKILHAQKLVKLLRFVPGLRLVALTGSVAAQNSKKDDDIDLLFITSPHALWLVRPLVISLITLFFRRRHPQEDHTHTPNAFCPNLWLDNHALGITPSKQSLYTAHEVLQIIPLLDRWGTYRCFIQANAWTKKYLANAYSAIIVKEANCHSRPEWAPGCRVSRGESVQTKHHLSLLLAPLNYLFYLIQLLYMHPKKTSETVHLHAAFLHTEDYSSRLDNHLKNQRDTYTLRGKSIRKLNI